MSSQKLRSESNFKFDFIGLEIGLYTSNLESANELRDSWYSQQSVEFQGLPYRVTDCATVPNLDNDGFIYLFKLKLWWMKEQLHNPKISIVDTLKGSNNVKGKRK